MNNEFDSLSKLFTYLYPALNTKARELKKKNLDIKEIDIWQYLINNVWNSKKKITIFDLVNDIMNLDGNKIIKRSVQNNN